MLDQQATAVAQERNCRKDPMSDDEARALVAGAETVWVARGKKIRQLASTEVTLDDLKGPTGNYRAPIVRAGDKLLVGFHPDTLRELIAS